MDHDNHDSGRALDSYFKTVERLLLSRVWRYERKRREVVNFRTGLQDRDFLCFVGISEKAFGKAEERGTDI